MPEKISEGRTEGGIVEKGALYCCTVQAGIGGGPDRLVLTVMVIMLRLVCLSVYRSLAYHSLNNDVIITKVHSCLPLFHISVCPRMN